MIEVPIKLLSPEAKIPTKAHETDAGFDLYSIEDVNISSLGITKIKTGISINIPPGYFALIQDRSGLGSKGYKVHGGVIDSGYIGEIIVCIGTTIHAAYSRGDYEYSYLVDSYRLIEAGTRIAQLVILPLPKVEFKQVESLEQTDRSEKGFGSSGL